MSNCSQNRLKFGFIFGEVLKFRFAALFCKFIRQIALFNRQKQNLNNFYEFTKTNHVLASKAFRFSAKLGRIFTKSKAQNAPELNL